MSWLRRKFKMPACQSPAGARLPAPMPQALAGRKPMAGRQISKIKIKKVRPRMKRWALGTLSLLLILMMVFGLNVRSPLPTAGLSAKALASVEALAKAGQSLK